jgi:cellulose synthase operon protein C
LNTCCGLATYLNYYSRRINADKVMLARCVLCFNPTPMTRPSEVVVSPALRMFAIGVLTAVSAISVACSSSPQDKEAKFLRSGQALLEKKDYSRALLQFKNAALAMPKDAEPYYRMGVASLEAGSLTNAIQALRKATELNPKHEKAQLKLAQLMTDSGNKEILQQAAGRLEGVLSASPENPEASDALAFAEWKLGKTDEAVGRLQETLQKFPARLQTSVELARLKLGQKDLAAAEQVLKQAVASAPQSAAAELALGQLYMLANQPAKA